MVLVAASFTIKESYWRAGTASVFLPKTTKHHPHVFKDGSPTREARPAEVVQKLINENGRDIFLDNILDLRNYCTKSNVAEVFRGI